MTREEMIDEAVAMCLYEHMDEHLDEATVRAEAEKLSDETLMVYIGIVI